MTARAAWGSLSLGVLCVSVGTMVWTDAPWQWIFVVLAGMNLVRALVNRNWRWAPQPLMWGLGLGYAYATGMSGWKMFMILCGGSILLQGLAMGAWRWIPHPVMWILGFAWAEREGVSGWAMLWMLCGASVFLGFLISLVPRRRPPEEPSPPPRRGDGVVIDAEVTGRE